MNTLYHTQPYPIGAIPQPIRDAHLEVRAHIQAPDALIAGSLLTAMSIACQRHIDVKLPTGQIRPVSLNILTIADSGERKTAVDKLVCNPIYEYDQRQKEAHKVAIQIHEAETSFWRSIESRIKREIRDAPRGQNIEHLEREIIEHYTKKPANPNSHRIIYQNITENAFIDALNGNRRSVAILSNEGEIVLKGGTMNNLGVLSSMWDGGMSQTVDRMDYNVDASDPRLTVSFMVQEGVFNDFMARKGRSVRDSGHLARYLVSYPVSTQGFRFMTLHEPVWMHLLSFHERIDQLLNEPTARISLDDTTRPPLSLSLEARELWVHTHNRVEPHLKPGGKLSSTKDFASKSLEIAGRVAAIFHHFNGLQGDISADTLQRALDIVGWYLDEFVCLFGDSNDVPRRQLNANRVLNHLYNIYWMRGQTVATRYKVFKNGPVRKNATDLDAALEQLQQDGLIVKSRDPRGKAWIQLIPIAFERIMREQSPPI